MEASAQRPLELILARNLLSSLSTPAFLVNAPGDLLFYNEAAGALLGHQFEETGRVSAADWTSTFGPLDEDGEPIPVERQPLMGTLRANLAAHTRHRIRSVHGAVHLIEVAAFPLVGRDGFHGAMVFFWPAGEGA